MADTSVQKEIIKYGSAITVNCPDEDDDIYIKVKSNRSYAGISLSLDEAEEVAKYIIGHIKIARKCGA